MAQIKKKFLATNAVDGTKVQYSNNEAFRAKSSFGMDVELFKLDSSNILQFLQLPRLAADPSDGSDVVRKAYLDGQVATEVAARIAADLAEQTAREAAIAAEQSRAEAAEAGLQAQIDALDSGSSAGLAQEIADRQAGDAALQSAVDAEKARIDAILSASTADKDSFKEIVDLINSVDTENDSAFASYVLSNNAALAQEVSDREAGDAALQAAVDAEETARESADSAEAAARQAADDQLADDLAQEVSDREAAVSAEQSRAETAEAALQAAIDQESNERQDADTAETQARVAADAVLQSAIDSEALARQNADSAEQTAREAGDAALQSAVSAEQAAREAADAVLQGQINNILSNTDPAALDSLTEVVAAFQSADGDLNSAISALGASASSALAQEVADRQAAVAAEQAAREAADSAEQAARVAGDAALQAAIDAEIAARVAADSAEQAAREAAVAAEAAARAAELPRHAKVSRTLTATDVSNGYIDLDHVALGSSCHVFIDRLACHESDDYTVSTVSGKTRVTFTGSFMTSEEGPAAGDLVRCGYMYKNADQAGGGGGGGGGGGSSNQPTIALSNSMMTGVDDNLAIFWTASGVPEPTYNWSVLLFDVNADAVVQNLAPVDNTYGIVSASLVNPEAQHQLILENTSTDERIAFSNMFQLPLGTGGGSGGGGSVTAPTLSMMFIGATSAYIAWDVGAQSGDFVRAWANGVPISPQADLTAGDLGKSVSFYEGVALPNGTPVSFFYYRADYSLVGETTATWTFG